MKKITTFFMSLLLVFSLTACQNTNSENDNSSSNTETQKSNPTSAPIESSNAADISDTTSGGSVAETTEFAELTTATGGKTLVVYYSASGNTEGVANHIAAATDGDILELVPVDDYSSDDLNYGDDDSRVVYEHDHPEARDIELVKDTVDNWEEYSVVFIGYPIWWQIAAWPVDGFVKANDFTGKTVIPFCTSASSGFGESGKLLADMAGTGNWLEGQRFSSGASEETVRTWVEGLELNK